MTDFFKGIDPIKYEGPQSKNPLAFKYYDADQKVLGKSMKDHLRFSVAYWHTFRGTGGDPFGPGTIKRVWESGSDPVETAILRTRAAFEFMKKLARSEKGVTFLSDVDVAEEQQTGSLVYLPIQDRHVSKQPLCLVHRAKRTLDTTASLFMEDIRDALRELVHKA